MPIAAYARGELQLHPVGERPPRLGVGRVREHLVVDVGDVAHERDATVAVLQPAAQHVEAQRAAQVPDVRTGLHRRSADVHRDVLGVERHEVAQGLRSGVVEPDDVTAPAYRRGSHLAVTQAFDPSSVRPGRGR